MTDQEAATFDRLAQELISAADIGRFIDEQSESINADDLFRLKTIVDQTAAKDFNAASRLAQAVWELGRRLGDSVGLAYAESALGRIEFCRGNYQQALDHYENALSSMTKTGRAVETAILQKQMVAVLMYLGDHKKALSIAAQALKVFKASREQEHLAEMDTNIGNLYCYLLNQYRKSLTYYNRARDIFVKLDNEVSRALVEHNIANALTELERIDEALALYERVSVVYRRHGMLVYAGQVDYNVAYLFFRRGQYNEAIKYYYQARESQQSLGDEVSVAWCSMDMAELHLQLSMFEESRRMAQEAQQGFLKFGNKFKAAHAQTLGGLSLAGLGQFQEARNELSEALEEFSRHGSRVMVGLLHAYMADIELKAQNYQTALINAQEARKIFARERLSVKAAFAELLMCKLSYLAGDLKQAHALLRSVEKKARRHAVSWMEYECRYLSGCLLESEGEYKKALEEFEQAVDMVGRVRGRLSADELKSAFLRDKLELFERTVSLSIACSVDAAAVLRYVEQAKSRSLADLLGHYMHRELAGKIAQPELRERFLELLNELHWNSEPPVSSRQDETAKRQSAALVKEKRRRCERELTEIFRRIQIENEDSAGLEMTASVELPQLQSILAPDEALIEYFAAQGRFSAFLITRENVRIEHGLASESEVERLLQEFRFQIEKFSMGKEYISNYLPRMQEKAKAQLHALYRMLVAPFADSIAGKKLIIVPHGLLHYLPFHALYDGEKHLIERHDVSYAPSATVYDMCRRKQTEGDGPMLVVGLSDEAAPEIAKEVDAIAALPLETKVLMGQEATLENLKRYGSNCRILHLATHGVFRQDNPLFSYLKLADAELTFYNTFDLTLHAELVTLSACHTGVNRIFPGDELHGLMRGFLYAGAPSIVMSLWEIDDCATSELMVAFYEHLLAGESKRSALCSAQREALLERPHPYYWSSFLLMGKPL